MAWQKIYMRHLYPECSSAEDACKFSESRDSISPTEVNHVFIGDQHNFIEVKVNGIEYFRPLEPLTYFKTRKTATGYFGEGYFGLEEFGRMVPFFCQNNGHFDLELSSKHTVESYTCYYQ